MVPSIIYVFPLFLLIVPLGLADRLPSLVLGYLSITLPFCMWLMWAFLRSIPLEVEEAGLIDGATRFQVFRLLVLPLAVPGIIATSIFSFIVAWNDYLIARIFMNTVTQLPLTVGVMHFFEGVHVDWGLMMASAVLMTVPLAVLFMFVQRHLMGLRYRQQQLQTGFAQAGLQPGEGTHGDAGRLGQRREGHLPLLPDPPQPGAHFRENVVRSHTGIAGSAKSFVNAAVSGRLSWWRWSR